MDWIDLVQDREQWRVLVNTLMNYKIVTVDTVQCDSICRYLMPLHVSVS
jgi:hypothetical protein